MFKNTLTKTLSATLSIGLLSVLLSLNTAQAADPVRGEKLAQTCQGCHGAPGLRNPGPVYNIPMIGGQHSEYIIAALQAYKAQTRDHKTMQAQAASLSDEDMADIAAFYSSISGNSRPSLVNKLQAKAGKEKSVQCASCHGANGDGDQSTFPKLAGQYENYLIQSLKGYRSGDRQNPIMSGFASSLTIDDIKALSAWFASQEGGLSAPQGEIFK